MDLLNFTNSLTDEEFRIAQKYYKKKIRIDSFDKKIEYYTKLLKGEGHHKRKD